MGQRRLAAAQLRTYESVPCSVGGRFPYRAGEGGPVCGGNDGTMDGTRIIADLSIEDVMQVWPDTFRVFLRRRMACIGCEVAAFHTVAEAARIYGVPADVLLAELRESTGTRDRRRPGGPGATPRQRGGPGRADRGPRSAAALP